MGRVRRLTAADIEGLLSKYGFVMVSQRGSHRKWRNQDRRLQVIVPSHGGKSLPLGTLVAIMKAAEVPDAEWRD